jgi:hypothetical protein
MKKLIFLFLIISSCAPSRFVEPLKKGQHAVALDVGGPLIEFGGLIIPTPLSSISYGYGIDSTKTVFGGLHTTSLLFGNFQGDIGATFKVFKQDKYIPAISISPAINFIKRPDVKGNVWPAADVNFYWNYGERNNYFYGGATNWYEPEATRAHGESTIQRFIFNPQVGHVTKFNSWQLQTELKFLALGADNELLFVPYRSVFGSKGATGLYINLIKTFK